eukprot:TRINITY_DN77_c0_g1_i2.p1 TRINITY_DN77_c0_g1~~TRINITY_DN77_c0_g1_i2.p1  ORF type:complete len:244 (-),score=42.55 TRINITY_DN77_c0_g1_i2:890-1621(-)
MVRMMIILLVLALYVYDTSAQQTQKLQWYFNSVSNPVSTVADNSGNGRVGNVVKNSVAGAGVAAVIPGYDGGGKAVKFPDRCNNADPTCKHACIQSPDHASLNPGTAAFQFGAWIKCDNNVDLTSDHGSNLVQKGFADQAQWKLQIDNPNGYASCLIRDTTAFLYKAQNVTFNVCNNVWNKVYCSRTATSLQLIINNQVSGSVAVPASFNVNTAGSVVSVGAKNAKVDSDQYHGYMDNVAYLA